MPAGPPPSLTIRVPRSVVAAAVRGLDLSAEIMAARSRLVALAQLERELGRGDPELLRAQMAAIDTIRQLVTTQAMLEAIRA